MQIARINIKHVQDGSSILKPNFHLNYGKKRIATIIENGIECNNLGSQVNNVFTGGIFKRVFVTDEKYGFPYISAQHMMNSNPIEVSKLISKKYTPRLDDMTLHKNQILVSCAGTVGNVRLITEDLNGVIGSQDIIRVIADDKKSPYGFIYAYLASPTAYNYIQSYIYGSVVPRIEPNTLAKLPIPKFSTSIKTKVHNLIVEATNMREEANKLLNKSVNILQNKLPNISHEKIYQSSVQIRRNNQLRIEATFLADKTGKFYRDVKKQGVSTKSISELSSEVFTPNIFKRIRVNNPINGVPYLSGSDLINQMPSFDSFLSRKMDNIDSYILREGWLTFQDSGTIGYLNLVSSYLDGVSATNNLVRVIPKLKDNYNYYIFCFFKTLQGHTLLKSLEYGSVQKHIDHHQIGNFQIPIYPELFKSISGNISKMLNFQGEACKLEKKAITIIEKEIDTWQKL